MYGGLLFVRVVVTIVPLQQGYAMPIVSRGIKSGAMSLYSVVVLTQLFEERKICRLK